MKTHILWFIGLIAIISILSWAPPGVAYWPPCQQVTGPTLSPDGTKVTFSVYDPARNTDVPGSWDVPVNFFGALYDVDNLTLDHGIVAWTAGGPGNSSIIVCSTYDPYLRRWQTETFTNTFLWADLAGVSVQDGIVSGYLAESFIGNCSYIATYDPGLGAWQLIAFQTSPGTSLWDPPIPLISKGVVVLNWVPFYEEQIDYATYDPIRHQWQSESRQAASNQTITDYGITTETGTVHFTVNFVGTDYHYSYGYSVADGYWKQNYYTETCAAFVAQPTSGKAPLTVWVTDMSIGAPTAFTYDWGDGTSSSSNRSDYHTYTGFGKYTLSHTVTRDSNYPPWTDTRTTLITPKAGGALPFLYLLLLD